MDRDWEAAGNDWPGYLQLRLVFDDGTEIMLPPAVSDSEDAAVKLAAVIPQLISEISAR